MPFFSYTLRFLSHHHIQESRKWGKVNNSTLQYLAAPSYYRNVKVKYFLKSHSNLYEPYAHQILIWFVLLDETGVLKPNILRQNAKAFF